jgi:hypothetical protein
LFTDFCFNVMLLQVGIKWKVSNNREFPTP